MGCEMGLDKRGKGMRQGDVAWGRGMGTCVGVRCACFALRVACCVLRGARAAPAARVAGAWGTDAGPERGEEDHGPAPQEARHHHAPALPPATPPRQ